MSKASSVSEISTFITKRLYLRTFCDIRLDTERAQVTEPLITQEVFQPISRLAYKRISSFIARDFNKWKALPVNQVKVLKSVSGYL